MRSLDSRPAKEARRPARLTLLREIKVDSPIHRLSTETKFVSVAGMSVTLSFFPSWGAIGIVALILVSATVLARVPASALPRPPSWFWALLVFTGLLGSVSGGRPYLHVGSSRVGLGAADQYAKFILIGVLLVFGGMVIGWTTALADVAPAMKWLFAPFRLIGAPVEEWAIAVSLCIRSFPLMLSEIRTLVAARRLRPAPELKPGQSNLDRLGNDAVDAIVAVLAISIRRSGELADAITARGGTGAITARKRNWHWPDTLALAIVGSACLVASQIPVP